MNGARFIAKGRKPFQVYGFEGVLSLRGEPILIPVALLNWYYRW